MLQLCLSVLVSLETEEVLGHSSGREGFETTVTKNDMFKGQEVFTKLENKRGISDHMFLRCIINQQTKSIYRFTFSGLADFDEIC